MSITETSHIPSGTEVRIPLSLVQEFLCVFDRGDTEGPFGPTHHIIHGWRVRGRIDLDALGGALSDVVARHESLRTTIVRGAEGRYQTVQPPSAPELRVRDIPDAAPEDRDRVIEDLLIECEADEFAAGDLPHLRAILARFDEEDAVLVLVVHHLAADGFSVRLIIHDIAHFYAARTGHAGHELPEPRQYREFVSWQLETFMDPDQRPTRDYWREKLRGARTFTLPTDRPRSAGLPGTTGVYRFGVGNDLMKPAAKLARSLRGSPFMVLLAAYTISIHRLTGATDIAAPTFTPGRGGDRFPDTTGIFFNFMPMRTDLDGCATYRDVLKRVRAVCIEGYAHDVPHILAEAPELMAPAMSDTAAPVVFQVFPYPFLLDGEEVGDLEYTEVRKRLVSQPVTSDIPDGALWTLNVDTTGELIGAVSYKTALFDESTMAEWVALFRDELRTLVTAPDSGLNPA